MKIPPSEIIEVRPVRSAPAALWIPVSWRRALLRLWIRFYGRRYYVLCSARWHDGPIAPGHRCEVCQESTDILYGHHGQSDSSRFESVTHPLQRTLLP